MIFHGNVLPALTETAVETAIAEHSLSFHALGMPSGRISVTGNAVDGEQSNESWFKIPGGTGSPIYLQVPSVASQILFRLTAIMPSRLLHFLPSEHEVIPHNRSSLRILDVSIVWVR